MNLPNSSIAFLSSSSHSLFARHGAINFCALFLILFAGCGRTGEIQYAPVNGKVLLEGEPLANATVMFIPQKTSKSANVGQPSMGKTDSSGSFSLATPKGISGAVVGLHKVSISTGFSDPATNEVVESERLPEEYNIRTTLEFEVPPSGTNTAMFSLVLPQKKSKPR